MMQENIPNIAVEAPTDILELLVVSAEENRLPPIPLTK